MADTPQTLPAMLTLLAGGTPNSINSAIIRELAVSVNRIYELYLTPSYANDAAAQAGGVPLGAMYRNGNIPQIRIV